MQKSITVILMIRELLTLYITFFKVGAVTFGGGLAMLPALERELTVKRKWATLEELLNYYAIGQTTPGIIAVNVSTFVGHKRCGIPGAIAATLGMVTPSLIIITIIAKFIANFEDLVWVQKALKGINVSVAALLTYSAVTLCKKTLIKWYSIFFYAGSFSAVYFFHVHTIYVILISALAGCFIHLASQKKNKEEEK